MNDFETMRARNMLMDDESKAALDRIEAERDELLARLGRMEGEYLAAPRMILERDAEVERLQSELEGMVGNRDRLLDDKARLTAEVERLRDENLKLRARIEEAWDEPAEEKE
jgi:predicted nuclease with TOPRIM domain